MAAKAVVQIFIKIRLDFRLRENDKIELRRLGIGRTFRAAFARVPGAPRRVPLERDHKPPLFRSVAMPGICVA